MGIVHGLQGNTRVIAVEVAVLDEIFDCIDDLFEPAFELAGGGSNNTTLRRLTGQPAQDELQAF
jgi:hypothetical protein